jgi:hypothetical protein
MTERELNSHASVIFRRAASYIRKYGWRVAGMSRDGLPRCSMGALASAHKASIWDKELAALMYQTLYEELDGLTLTEFNYKYNDGEIIARLFDQVAVRLSGKGSLIPSS